MIDDPFENIGVVLAGVKDSRNVGAVCRAMKNMGLSNLIVTGAAGLDPEAIEVLAVHANDVYERARFFTTLKEAVGGAEFVAGITRRQGKFRKYVSLDPHDLALRMASMKQGRAFLVFGNEEAGLAGEELELCHAAVHIPSSSAFPSLNLSHAVQIIAYEIFTVFQDKPLGKYSPVSGSSLDELTAEIAGSLASLGFFTQVTPDDTRVFLRDIFARAMLDANEAERLRRMFDKIKGIAGKKRS